MIKTCFGTKLMIKTWFTHFLSLVQFVAIYALLGGPIRPYICGRGTPTDFKGWALVSLSLAEVGQIDVGLLATLCPALVHLSLLWNSQYLVGNSIPPDFFPKLRTAELSCREREDEEDMLEPPQDQLAIILSSPMLTSLKLSNSANLTDIFVSNLLVSPNSCLQLLQTLHLTRCNEVSLSLGPFCFNTAFNN